MSTDGRRGLGRGLSAIFSGAEQHPDDGVALRARLVGVALDAIAGSVELDVCGFIENAGSDDASLILRSPDLAMLDTAATYRLYAAISRAEHLPAGRHPLVLAAGSGAAIVAVSPHHRGVFVFGADQLTEDDNERVAQFCESFVPVLREYNMAPKPGEQVNISVDDKDGATHAEVTVGQSVGFGSATTPGHAVARAALSAVREQAKLVSVTDVHGKDGVATLVVVNGDDNPLGMGAAPLGSDPNMAVAVATLRAARAL